MRAGIIVEVTPEDRTRLYGIVGNGNSPQKHAARARIILATSDGCGTLEIMRRSGLSKPVVWWPVAGQDAAARQGPTGRRNRQAHRRSDPRRSAWRDDPLDGPRYGGSRWRQPSLGAARVDGAWPCASSHPHVQIVKGQAVRREIRRCRRPLYRSAGHAVVLSVDEKSQIQALDRTQPGLPMKKGRAGTMTHDYK